MSTTTFQPVKSAAKPKSKQKLSFCTDEIYDQVWAEMKAEYLAKDAEFSREWARLPLWNQSSAHELSQQHQAWCEAYRKEVAAEVERRKLAIQQAKEVRRLGL